MKNANHFPTPSSFTLPNHLDKFIEQAVEGIRPLMKEDYYRTKLKEHAWNLYQEELQKGYDSDQAETLTMKRLGDSSKIHNQIQLELSQEKKQSENTLSKFPYKAGILFLIISLIGWCFVTAIFIKDPYFLINNSTPSPYPVSHNIFVVTCITTALTCWCFYFSHRLKNR